MKIGDKIYEIGNSGTIIVKSVIDRIYTISGVTIYDTKFKDGTNGVSFDKRAIGESIFLSKQAAQEKADRIQKIYNEVEE